MTKPKPPKQKKPSQRWIKYKIENNILKKSQSCPKCGSGIFLAIHKDRKHCGKCGYMEKI
ncbi:MAG TPA: 30S ribosomal protein S27ae [Candidatus Nanoarchaeia archaeon]|nr:30S ribosomal protein S27ae [Candidatus Nanoarchaeia archaeon]